MKKFSIPSVNYLGSKLCVVMAVQPNVYWKTLIKSPDIKILGYTKKGAHYSESVNMLPWPTSKEEITNIWLDLTSRYSEHCLIVSIPYTCLRQDKADCDEEEEEGSKNLTTFVIDGKDTHIYSPFLKVSFSQGLK